MDFHETYSPVARFTSIRLVLALASLLNLTVHQMDVETAFLNAELKEDIYMYPPAGMIVAPGNVLKLNRTLYGLKQAPREWYGNLHSFLLSQGFSSVSNDSCVYIRKTDRGTVVIAVYVDDLIIAGSSLSLVNSIKHSFHNRYKMSDMGPLEYVLGVRVDQDTANRTISLSQRQYIVDLLTKYNMSDCSTEATPMDDRKRLSKDMSPVTAAEKAEMEKVPYREAVGSLLWLSNGTRPDISYAVSQVAKYMSNPGMEHWKAVKRILRYLKGTMDRKIVYNGKSNIDIIGYDKGECNVTPNLNPNDSRRKRKLDAFADADWGSDSDTRRSVTGYVFMLAGGPISWQSRQQSTVALSSMEAEYMSACAATQEAIWLRSVLIDLGIMQKTEGIVINEDNKSCIEFSNNPGSYRRTKHIDIKYHFVRERTLTGEVKLEYIPTKSQIADIFTKALAKDLFTKFRDLLLGV